MTYRDNLEAARTHHEELARELAEVRSRLVDRDDLGARERTLVAAMAESAAQVDHLRSRANLPLLRRIEIASPCHENWDSMIGDGRARECRRCEKVVYDLSAMSAAEAEALLASRGAVCVRFYRRADGTVMTSDCPEGVRRKRRRRIVVAVAAAGLATAGLAVAGASFRWQTREVPAERAIAPQAGPTAPGPGAPVTMGPPPPPDRPESVMGKPPQPEPEDYYEDGQHHPASWLKDHPEYRNGHRNRPR